jgi:4-amino-4-deoxy-L-arabinose transferase-like glycosyltransferase
MTSSVDELYFIVCGRHPAWGYVDQPPLVPLLAAASQTDGESFWLLRIGPALFHAGAVLAACAVARLLGGGRSAQILAGLATGTAPVLLGVGASLGTTHSNR